MRNKIIIGVVAVIVIGLAVGFRLVQLMPYPKGEFNWVDSPNRRHRAYVYVLTDKGFFGGTREIYRLKVEFAVSEDQRISIFEDDVLQADARGPVSLAQLESVVDWAPDGSLVTYKIGKQDITVDLPF